jgi:chloramphenicol-sensitive protein RarD
MSKSSLKHATESGVLYALAAYSTWGFVPLFWRELRHIPPIQILAHRIVWSVVFFIIIFLIRRNLRNWISFAFQASILKKSLPSAMAIAFNWGLYIWAVNSGHALEASLGYFINPLLNVVLGALIFAERLNPLQKIAFCLAGLGVLILTLAEGQFPWIALSLASSFSLYGVIRKKTELKGTSGTAVESLLMIPLAAAILLSPELSTVNVLALSPMTQSVSTLALLSVGGALTALPLVWFAEAAQRLPLSALGFYQYISPTFQFLIAVFAFNEPLKMTSLVSFIFIWSGLGFFSFDATRKAKTSRR